MSLGDLLPAGRKQPDPGIPERGSDTSVTVPENMTTLDLSSRAKCAELWTNLVLFSLVLICWFYVLYAGREATLRYLEKIDFSEPVERITVLQLMKHSENTNSTAFIEN